MKEEKPPEDDLGKKLTAELGEATLEKEIAGILENFHGFITREVAIKLIARKKGILKKTRNKVAINEIQKGQKKIDVRGEINRIWPEFEYKSGKRSRVVEIKDETGTIPLVLWNDDISMAKSLRAGDVIEIENAYEKSGELHMGYSGSLKIAERADFVKLDRLIDGKRMNIRAFVSKIEGGKLTPTRLFVFFVSDGTKEIRTVMWDRPERGMALDISDEVIIENAFVKGNEIQIYDDARLFSRRPGEHLCGELKEMEAENEQLKVKIGEDIRTLERGEAMEFLNVRVAGDINLATVVNLKKESMLNSKVTLKLKK